MEIWGKNKPITMWVGEPVELYTMTMNTFNGMVFKKAQPVPNASLYNSI